MHQTCVNTAKADNVNGRLVFGSDAERPNTSDAFGGLCLLSQESAANSFYHGLELSLQRRFADGFQVQLSYTHSKAVSESAQVNGLYGNNNGGVAYYPEPHLLRSLAAYHVANSFTASWVWQLPFGNDLGGAAGAIAGGWQLGGIVRMADGPPHMVSVGTPRGIRGLGYNGRSMPPDLGPVGNNNPVLGGAVKYFNTSYSRSASGCASSGAAFCAPPKNTLGTMGRNTVIQPGLANIDFSITKNIQVGENVNLQFRTEIFNLFDRANFSRANMRVDRSSGGRIDSTTLTERQIQLGLRLTF